MYIIYDLNNHKYELYTKSVGWQSTILDTHIIYDLNNHKCRLYTKSVGCTQKV